MRTRVMKELVNEVQGKRARTRIRIPLSSGLEVAEVADKCWVSFLR